MKNEYQKRKDSLRLYKQLLNLPRYDLALKRISSGRLTNYGIDTTGFSMTPAKDISLDVEQVKASIIPSTIGTLGSQVSSIYSNYALNYTTKAAASAANAKILADAGYKFGEGLEYPTQAAAEKAFTAAGEKGLVKSGMSGVGKAAGYIGGIVNAAQLAGGLYNQYNNYTSDSDLLNMSSKITLSSNGVLYDTYGGFNADDVRERQTSSNLKDIINNSITGASAGFGLGGWIGGLIGLGLGGGLSIFAGDRARRKTNQNIKDTLTMMRGYNRQSESNASSLGARSNYYRTHTLPSSIGYDTGKPNLPKLLWSSDSGRYGLTWNADGQQLGPINSYVGFGESLIDFKNGDATYVDKGTKRVDNQPSSIREGDDKAIAGNMIDPTTNISYADQAAPYTKVVEKMNSIIDNADISTPTGKLNTMLAERSKNEAFRNLEAIINKLTALQLYENNKNNMNNYNKGKCGKKLPKFDKANMYGVAGAHLLSSLFPAMQYFNYKGATPSAESSYSPNYNSQLAAAIMASRYDDPYEDKQLIKDANRQAIYTINHSPFSQGQRMAMLTALNTNYAKLLADRYAKSREINNQYAGELAQYLATTGSEDQKLRISSTAQRNSDYAAAVARRQLGMENALKGIQSEWQTLAQDMQKYDWFRLSLAMQDKQLRLWDDQNRIERDRIANWGGPVQGVSSIVRREPGLYYRSDGTTGYWDGQKWTTLGV